MKRTHGRLERKRNQEGSRFELSGPLLVVTALVCVNAILTTRGVRHALLVHWGACHSFLFDTRCSETGAEQIGESCIKTDLQPHITTEFIPFVVGSSCFQQCYLSFVLDISLSI